MVARQSAAEEKFASKVGADVLDQQQNAFETEIEKNEELKNRLLEEYEKRMANDEVSESDRQMMLAELHAKIASIDDMIRKEEDQQNSTLQEALARRRAKKEKLRVLITNLADKKEAEDATTRVKLERVADEESKQLATIDTVIDRERKSGEHNIEVSLAAQRRKKLAEMEKKLDDFKRKNAGGKDHEFLFADMLTQYGNLVKKVDQDLADEQKVQQHKLEEKLAKRKQQIRQEIADGRKEKESQINSTTIDKRTNRQ